MRKRLIAILILALAGIAVSAYALHLHYDVKATSFCNFNGTFNCDVVNKSWASQIAGVPVALIGIIGYALLVIGSAWLLIVKKIPNLTWGAMALASAGGFGFALFLTGVEFFSLHTFCVVCLTSQLLILAITWMTWATPEARQGLRSWFFASASSS